MFTNGGTKEKDKDIIVFVKEVEKLGAGEIMINSIDKDGTMEGYDLELIKLISQQVKIPVIACGGAGDLQDFSKAVKEGKATAVAAGSFFVFNGKNKGILINYPDRIDLEKTFNR